MITLGKNIGIAILLISVIVVAGCTSTSTNDYNQITESSSVPAWDGFDYCKCLGSQDCYFYRNLCRLDVNEGSDQYLKSEACYQYDVTYVQLFNPPKTCNTDSDGHLARVQTTQKYWGAIINLTAVAEENERKQAPWSVSGNGILGQTKISGVTIEGDEKYLHIYGSGSGTVPIAYRRFLYTHNRISFDYQINKPSNAISTFKIGDKQIWSEIVFEVGNDVGLYHIDLIYLNKTTANITVTRTNSTIENFVLQFDSRDFFIRPHFGENFDFKYKNIVVA